MKLRLSCLSSSAPISRSFSAPHFLTRRVPAYPLPAARQGPRSSAIFPPKNLSHSFLNSRNIPFLKHPNCSSRTSQSRSSTLTSGCINTPQTYNYILLRSSFSTASVVALAIVVGAALAGVWNRSQSHQTVPAIDLEDEMVGDIPEGRPGNLTPEQEEKLRKLWVSVFQLCGVTEGGEQLNGLSATPGETPAAEAEEPKKKRFGLFKKDKEPKSSSSGSPANGGEDDKYGETKQYHEALAKYSPETIRQTIWNMVKHDHPDAILLRFLRARKWDIEKALVMMISTMNWRHGEMGVDEDIMKNGEAGAVENEQNGQGKDKQLGHDFLEQIRMGKSYLHGVDKKGRPICVVRVRLHKQGEQCEESLEKYTVYIIETARMVLSPPVDTATIVFDMTGFSMANMDYTPVKFMIKCFEANYPESLGTVLVHNAPWVFQGIWKIIRGWLDPVVAAKVHFTNNKKDLEEYIEPSRIVKELGGDENWEYKYVEPIPGENDKMKDTDTREKLLQSRAELVKKFEALTLEWIQNPEGENGDSAKAERTTLAKELKEDYWRLDPYIRARSLYDRQGAIQVGGKVNWYEKAAAGHDTAADDVD